MATQNVKFIPPVLLNWHHRDSLGNVLITTKGINNHIACSFLSRKISCVGEEFPNMSDF